MRKEKTYFEQVPVEMAETALEKATTLAAIIAAYPALFPMLDREVMSVSSKQRERFFPRECR